MPSIAVLSHTISITFIPNKDINGFDDNYVVSKNHHELHFLFRDACSHIMRQ